MDATAGRRIRGHNTGIRAGLVRVVIRRRRVVVDDVDRFHIHRERDLVIIRLSPGPLDRSLAVGRVTSGPDAQLHDHWRLRVVLPIDRIGILECAHGGPVNVPGDGRSGPDDFVRVEFVLRAADGLPDCAVVGGRVALAKVVGLDLGSVGSSAFLSSSVFFLWYHREPDSPSRFRPDHPIP